MKKFTMTKDVFISAKWASCNKQNTLDEYKYQVVQSNDFIRIDAKIEEVYFLSQTEWDDLTNNFLESNSMYDGKGGSGSHFQVPEEYADVSSYYSLPQEIRDQYQSQAYRVGLLLINEKTGESCVVDPQGYDYARYVGIPCYNGFMVNVFRTSSLGDCTNSGVSSCYNSLYVMSSDAPLSTQNIYQVLIANTKNLYGKEIKQLVPLVNFLKGDHTMNGGNFAYTSDQTYRERIAEFPLPIHDRVE